MQMNEGLEKVMEDGKKGKIVEDVFQRYLGVTIRELNQDITRNIDSPLLDFISEEEKNLKTARRTFLRHYVIRLLERHSGNVKAASDEAEVTRRTMHRLISDLHIDVSVMRKRRPSRNYETKVHNAIEKTLQGYEKILHPEKLDAVYEKIDDIAKDIADGTEEPKMLSLKEAEDAFLSVFIRKSIARNAGNISKAAREMGIRYETLNRKMNSLIAKGYLRR